MAVADHGNENSNSEKASWPFLPISFQVKNQRCLIVGDNEQALRKAELLIRADATLAVTECQDLSRFSSLPADRVSLEAPSFSDELLSGVCLVVVALDDKVVQERIAKVCASRHLPVNVVERSDLSTFIFPSIIDRNPIQVAISSSGDAPVLTRLLRNQLESVIPHGIGALAKLAGQYRARVREVVTSALGRRRFWEQALQGTIADLVYAGRVEKATALLEDALVDPKAFSDDGEVYLVGAGPGDPDLLSFRALRLMRQADVVLYDRLVSPRILDLVRRDAEKINVGKARSRHTLPQQDINQLLVELAKQGRRVLRLKGGDPFIFGRGGEEIDTLAEQGIPFQVVPGITAAAGCAAYSGIPLTHRDYSQSVRFVTGHLKDDSCDLPWSHLIQEQQTLVFYMGLMGLPIITRNLIKHGMPGTTPIALISKGTLPDQKVLTGNLKTIVEQVEKAKLPGPTIIIIGEVVKLRDKLKWME